MLISKKNRIEIYKYLFREGVLYAEKDFNLPKHPSIDVPNLHVIKLMQSLKSKELVTELPVLQIIPVEATRLKLQNTFRAPVYVTQSRRNAMGVGLVFEADLATRDHSSHWVLQGVALTLNIS